MLNPRDTYRKCCELLGEILENDSVAIYHVSGGAFARLVAASPAIAEDAARSLTLEQLAPLLGDGGRSNLWVNRELTPGLPMFGYTIERDGAPAVLIFVRSAAENQMTLYYQNLFRILCGLVESALGRAFDYEAVAQDKRCVDGTCVLKQAAFGQELAAEQALADSKMGSFLLLRVVPGMEPVGELVGAIGSAIRESDAAGLVDGDVLYLLMRQAKACDLPIIRERLSAKHIAVEPVDGEDIVALLQHISYTGDGEGGVPLDLACRCCRLAADSFAGLPDAVDAHEAGPAAGARAHAGCNSAGAAVGPVAGGFAIGAQRGAWRVAERVCAGVAALQRRPAS